MGPSVSSTTASTGTTPSPAASAALTAGGHALDSSVVPEISPLAKVAEKINALSDAEAQTAGKAMGASEAAALLYQVQRGNVPFDDKDLAKIKALQQSGYLSVADELSYQEMIAKEQKDPKDLERYTALREEYFKIIEGRDSPMRHLLDVLRRAKDVFSSRLDIDVPLSGAKRLWREVTHKFECTVAASKVLIQGLNPIVVVSDIARWSARCVRELKDRWSNNILQVDNENIRLGEIRKEFKSKGLETAQQGFERLGRERARLEREKNELEGFGGKLFASSRDGLSRLFHGIFGGESSFERRQNRIAQIARSVAQIEAELHPLESESIATGAYGEALKSKSKLGDVAIKCTPKADLLILHKENGDGRFDSMKLVGDGSRQGVTEWLDSIYSPLSVVRRKFFENLKLFGESPSTEDVLAASNLAFEGTSNTNTFYSSNSIATMAQSLESRGFLNADANKGLIAQLMSCQSGTGIDDLIQIVDQRFAGARTYQALTKAVHIGCIGGDVPFKMRRFDEVRAAFSDLSLDDTLIAAIARRKEDSSQLKERFDSIYRALAAEGLTKGPGLARASAILLEADFKRDVSALAKNAKTAFELMTNSQKIGGWSARSDHYDACALVALNSEKTSDIGTDVVVLSELSEQLALLGQPTMTSNLALKLKYRNSAAVHQLLDLEFSQDYAQASNTPTKAAVARHIPSPWSRRRSPLQVYRPHNLGRRLYWDSQDFAGGGSSLQYGDGPDSFLNKGLFPGEDSTA